MGRLILSPERPDVAFRTSRRRCRFAPRAGKGFSKSKLMVEVRSENGSPTYQAEMVMSLTGTEKARRVAYPGAEVPLRYDRADPQAVAIASIAMGCGDPYEMARKKFEGG